MSKSTKNGSASEWHKLHKEIGAIEKQFASVEDKLYTLEIALEDHLRTAIIDVINDEHESADVSSEGTWAGYELALQRAGKIVAWARGFAKESDALNKQEERLAAQKDELGVPADVRAKRAALHAEDVRENAKWRKARELAETAVRS